MNLAAIDIIGARHPPVSIQLGSCFPKCGALLAALPHLLARRLNHLWSAPFSPTVFEGAFVCICAAYLFGELAKDRVCRRLSACAATVAVRNQAVIFASLLGFS
jgi:hypothetical protein